MTPDLSALTAAFVEFGGTIFRRQVNTFSAGGPGVLVYKNVKAPIALTKLSAQGGPRPYREQDDTSGNGVMFADRSLTVYQSKWDFDVDPERYRNTYLASDSRAPFYEYIIDQVSREYMASLNDVVAYFGVRNAAGSAAIDIADGWKKIMDDEVTALHITPIVTGAITAANAVTQVEIGAESVPTWMRERGFEIWVSYSVLDKYKKHYRALNGFAFNPDAIDGYRLDGMNARLVPKSFLGASQRVIITLPNNFVMGTDGEQIKVAASMRRNIIEVRMMMPVGFQIQDLDALRVNDLV